VAQEVATSSIIDQTQSAKESIAVELHLAVETLHDDAVSTTKSNIATRWNDAVAGIDTTAKSCSDALARLSTNFTVTFKSTSNATHDQLESDKTLHVASLQQLKDQFEQELTTVHDEHLAQFDQKLKELWEEMIALTKSRQGCIRGGQCSSRIRDSNITTERQ